jgi:hypothetical protein
MVPERAVPPRRPEVDRQHQSCRAPCDRIGRRRYRSRIGLDRPNNFTADREAAAAVKKTGGGAAASIGGSAGASVAATAAQAGANAAQHVIDSGGTAAQAAIAAQVDCRRNQKT